MACCAAQLDCSVRTDRAEQSRAEPREKKNRQLGDQFLFLFLFFSSTGPAGLVATFLGGKKADALRCLVRQRGMHQMDGRAEGDGPVAGGGTGKKPCVEPLSAEYRPVSRPSMMYPAACRGESEGGRGHAGTVVAPSVHPPPFYSSTLHTRRAAHQTPNMEMTDDASSRPGRHLLGTLVLYNTYNEHNKWQAVASFFSARPQASQ